MGNLLESLSCNRDALGWHRLNRMTTEHVCALQRDKKNYQKLMNNNDRNNMYLFMFRLSIKSKIYNLSYDNHDIYNIS